MENLCMNIHFPLIYSLILFTIHTCYQVYGKEGLQLLLKTKYTTLSHAQKKKLV
jgi:hypothetical protein